MTDAVDKRVVRVGLLSTSYTNKNIIPAIRVSSRATLVAVGSRSLERAREYAAQNEIPIAMSSDDLIASDSVDAVYIATPPAKHFEWCMKAIERGKHVLCEKPLALTVDDVDRLSEAAKSRGLVLCEANMSLYIPSTTRAASVVKSAPLGRIVSMRGVYTFPLTRGSTYRNDAIADGGGSLWDVGCYPIGLAITLINGYAVDGGEAVLIPDASGKSETSCVAMVLLKSMNMPEPRRVIPLHVVTSFTAPPDRTFTVIGERGDMVIHEPFKDIEKARIDLRLVSENGNVDATSISIGAEELRHVYQGEVEAFAAAILKLPVALPLLPVDGVTREAIRIIQRIHQCARTQ